MKKIWEISTAGFAHVGFLASTGSNAAPEWSRRNMSRHKPSETRNMSSTSRIVWTVSLFRDFLCSCLLSTARSVSCIAILSAPLSSKHLQVTASVQHSLQPKLLEAIEQERSKRRGGQDLHKAQNLDLRISIDSTWLHGLELLHVAFSATIAWRWLQQFLPETRTWFASLHVPQLAPCTVRIF